MFFDSSFQRLGVLLMGAFALAGLVALTMAAWYANRPLERAVGQVLARVSGEMSYWIWFKIPVGLAAAGAADIPSASARTQSGTAASVPVLLYHGESGGPSMSRATFVEQLRALHADGWRTITLKQFEAFMQGTARIPAKSFLLTFDDGRKDTFYSADPVLKDLGYTAVMFVITGLSLPDNGDTAVNGFYLNKAELAYMAESGRWELESHGSADHGGYNVPTASSTLASLDFIRSTHFLSNKFWVPVPGRLETTQEYADRIAYDLASAKRTLEQDFGTSVTAYAYPFNDFGQESVNFPGATDVIAEVVRKLYAVTFYQTWPGNGDSFNYPGQGTTFMKRIEPEADWGGAELVAVLNGGRAKTLPYDARGYFGPDWQANWGVVSPGETLTLDAAPSTTGAAAFLDGTEGWRNYVVSAQAAIQNGTISLIARHTETGTPYLVCAFSGDHIYLEKHVGTSQTTLASAPYEPPTLPSTYHVGMTVSGEDATCSAYGVTVSQQIPGLAQAGGVGASVWGPTLGEARVRLTQFSAAEL